MNTSTTDIDNAIPLEPQGGACAISFSWISVKVLDLFFWHRTFFKWHH